MLFRSAAITRERAELGTQVTEMHEALFAFVLADRVERRRTEHAA